MMYEEEEFAHYHIGTFT